VHHPPLVTARLRVPALLIALLGWLVAALLGVRYAGETRAGGFDTALTHGLRDVVGNPTPLGKWAVTPPTTATRILGTFSSPVVTYAVIVAVVLFAAWRRRWEVLGLAVLAPGVCVLLTELFKPLVDRRHSGYLSYPSGHTVSSVAALTVAVLAITWGAPAWRTVLAWIAWLLVVVCVLAGLVAMNYHYPTDTFGGLGLALGVTLPGAVLADGLSVRRAGLSLRRAARSADPGTGRPDGTPRAGTSSDIPRPASPR
jgi:membrane-associated phospholipid phosphatase